MISPHTRYHRAYGCIRAIVNALPILALVVLTFSTAPARAAEPVTLLVLGDSLAAGYNLPPDAAFPVRLEARLRERGHAVTVINGGVSGDTSAGGLARLDWMLSPLPDAAIVELGANDALRGLPPEHLKDNLAAIISRLQDKGVAVLLAGMLAPPNMGAEYTTAFNGVYPAVAETYDVPLYPFFLDGVAAQPDLLQADGMHPNTGGVDIMVSAILPQVEALLDSLATPRTEAGQ